MKIEDIPVASIEIPVSLHIEGNICVWHIRDILGSELVYAVRTAGTCLKALADIQRYFFINIERISVAGGSIVSILRTLHLSVLV